MRSGDPAFGPAYGVTVRAHFASIAMQAFINGGYDLQTKRGESRADAIADRAVEQADALIKRLQRP